MGFAWTVLLVAACLVVHSARGLAAVGVPGSSCGALSCARRGAFPALRLHASHGGARWASSRVHVQLTDVRALAVTAAGIAASVDLCGVCGGDGTSCSCTNGYLGLSQADTDAAVLVRLARPATLRFSSLS